MADVRIELGWELKQAIEAVAGLAGVVVFNGSADDESFVVPCIEIDVGQLERRPARKLYKQTDNGDGTYDLVERTHRASGPIMVSMYTADRTERMGYEPDLTDLFEPDAPDAVSEVPPPGLELELADHHGAKARIRLEDTEEHDADGLGGGYYLLRLSLEATTSILKARTVSAASYSNEVEAEVE